MRYYITISNCRIEYIIVLISGGDNFERRFFRIRGSRVSWQIPDFWIVSRRCSC